MSLPPTDLPTYYSYRLTVDHSRIDEVKGCMFDVPDYIIWPHNGSNGDNPHFHVAIPSPPHKFDDKMRKRLKKTFGSGNQTFMGKYMHNTVRDFLHYVLKEPTDEWVCPSGQEEFWKNEILNTPPYLPLEEFKKATGRAPKKERLGYPMLTFSNVIKQALLYRKANGLQSQELGDILAHMCVHTDWEPSKELLSKGLDHMHFKWFTFKCQAMGPPPKWWEPRSDILYKYN